MDVLGMFIFAGLTVAGVAFLWCWWRAAKSGMALIFRADNKK